MVEVGLYSFNVLLLEVFLMYLLMNSFGVGFEVLMVMLVFFCVGVLLVELVRIMLMV